MHRKPERGFAKTDHYSVLPNMHRLSWDDLRYFLATAMLGSFRKASQNLKVSTSTVTRRIERLEDALGARLFDRLPDGVNLTFEGIAILEKAKDIEQGFCGLIHARTDQENTQKGAVSLSMTEGLGSYWVMPHLTRFQREYSFITINMRCAMTCADILRLEADISVQFERPKNPDLVIVKLGRLHIHPFASKDYLDFYGTPTQTSNLLEHRFIQQVAPQLDEGDFAKFFGLDDMDDCIAMRTDSTTTHFHAIENGAGIGVLPSFALAIGADLVPLDIGKRHYLDIWMTYHPDVKKVPRKAILIDWIKDVFDHKSYPWFKDEFIHPDNLVEMTQASSSFYRMPKRV